MIMLKKTTIVSIFSLAHFLVDFACAYLLYHMVYGLRQWYLSLLIYNFCSFALQMPFGLLADRINKNAVFAAIGCGCVAAAYGFGTAPFVIAALAGVGNGLYHIGGGIEVLNISTKKAYALGIFVSPGAFGIYFGAILGKHNNHWSGYVIAALLAAAAIIVFLYYGKRHTLSTDNLPVSFQETAFPGILLAVACLFFVVCLRSFVGMILAFPWKSQSIWGTVLVCAVVFGKISGGFLADWVGAWKASVLSLGLASVLFLFSSNPLAGLLAVFLFNMTMPITLWAVARIMKGCKGFSFGLLTFGLFLGFIPVFLGLAVSFLPVVYAASAALSLTFLLVGLRKAAF